MNASCKERKKRCFKFFSVAFVLGAIFSVLAGTFFALQPSAYAEEVDATLPVKKSEQLTTGTTQKSTGQFLPDQGYFDTGLVEDKAVLMKNDDDDDDEGPIKTCMNSGAGKSLGWVLCPILEFLSESATKTYNTFVKPSMQIEPALFSTEQFNGSTFKAWETFRNFANIAFIILFIVVIISQITGVGINNYGIKKILPKLIVAAVLVNVSYFICQILIDVSNIVGNSIQSLFEGLANSAELKSIQDDFQIAVASGDKTTELISIGAKTTLSSVAIIGAIAGVGAIIINPAILLSLLVSAIGIVISVFTLFILLSARQALVVVLTVLSPVAFVCFMLPNTKGLFDKWLKIMKAMLLVYPICGLLVGGGDYVSKLILSLASTKSDSFFIALTAMIVGIVPIFFIPKVLRDAFDGVGKLGAKITDYGKSIRGRTQSGIQKSEAYRRAQTRMNAGVNLKGEPRNGIRQRLATTGVGHAIGLDRNMANARQAYLKDIEANNRVEDMMGTGFQSAVESAKDRASKLRTEEYESLIINGKALIGEGENATSVVANDPTSVGRYHAQAMARFTRAVKSKNDAEKAEAMAQIKAAQNILSKTDKGRAEVQNNLQNVLQNAQDGEDAQVLTAAAGHLMGAYADKYKASNRGEEKLIRDLSTTALAGDAAVANLASLKGSLGNGDYMFYGHDKYTAESLVNADESAIKNFADAIANNDARLGSGQRLEIQRTAYEALQKQRAGTLNIKPEVRKQLETIVASYNPQANPSPVDVSQMISHGAYQDINSGAIIHLRQMDNGQYLDDGGNQVDITHYKQQ